jgi:hypothetical protein
VSLATTATVISNCGLAGVTADRITPHLPAAAAAVERRVGATVYAAVVAAAGAPYDADLKTAFTRAESLLAGAIVLRVALHQLNDGGMVTAQFAPDGSSSSLATARQREATAAAWESEAAQTLAPWECLLSDTDPLLSTRSCRAGRLVLTALGSGLQGADRA